MSRDYSAKWQQGVNGRELCSRFYWGVGRQNVSTRGRNVLCNKVTTTLLSDLS